MKDTLLRAVAIAIALGMEVPISNSTGKPANADSEAIREALKTVRKSMGVK